MHHQACVQIFFIIVHLLLHMNETCMFSSIYAMFIGLFSCFLMLFCSEAESQEVVSVFSLAVIFNTSNRHLCWESECFERRSVLHHYLSLFSASCISHFGFKTVVMHTSLLL